MFWTEFALQACPLGLHCMISNPYLDDWQCHWMVKRLKHFDCHFSLLWSIIKVFARADLCLCTPRSTCKVLVRMLPWLQCRIPRWNMHLRATTCCRSRVSKAASRRLFYWLPVVILRWQVCCWLENASQKWISRQLHFWMAIICHCRWKRLGLKENGHIF